jgi:cytochrome P450
MNDTISYLLQVLPDTKQPKDERDQRRDRGDPKRHDREKGVRNGEGRSQRQRRLLLQSNMDSGKGSLRMSTEDVIEECKLFYFAGMETTSVLLTWTLVVLSMHPEWQDRAREEVISAFGRDKPTFDALSRLKTASVCNIPLHLYEPQFFNENHKIC